MLRTLRNAWSDFRLPAPAKAALDDDRRGLPEFDPGPEAALKASLEWLKLAQDCSASADGGVARDYSLLRGWSTSYPETTGYIVPTVLACAHRFADSDLRERGRRMVDWLISIQFPEGGFQGGKIDAQPRVPVTFNTGQILMGLVAAVVEFGNHYRHPMNLAATWLRDTLDPDGCWRRYPTPFAVPGEKAYETHVSWALFDAERAEPARGYAQAGLRQVHWALRKQHPNGWFESCDLADPAIPLTHTIGYVLRGVIEAYRYLGDKELLSAARKTANGVLSAMRPDGFLPGCLDKEWRAAADWACLTGNAQIASCMFLLHEATGDSSYLEAALRANRFVRRTIRTTGRREVRGGVRGSFPINGSYGQFEYLNWAAKFSIDANLHELDA
jgi:hypothetical protein